MFDERIDWTTARSRPINWIQTCDTIADTYTRGIAHGVQKDAVQNGVGAIRGAGPLRFVFELVSNSKGRFLTMTDSGTVGLTGRVLSREEYAEDLPSDERWGRFESLGFTTADPDSIGARGQGKFVFVAASKGKLIIYDSLRMDGTYRMGYTQAQINDCPMDHADGDDGRRRLGGMTGLEPLSESGTRVIIVEPVDELVRAVRDGEFLSAIEETWFRLIEKGGADIHVVVGDRDHRAGVPAPYPVPAQDSDQVKVWGQENVDIRVGAERYRVKRLQVGYRVSARVPEQLRGVAVLHFGMKICAIHMDAASEMRDRVFGLIEFDTDLDRELRKTENQRPNHYDLDYRRRVPQAVKAFVEEQLRRFGEAKLGLRMDARARRQRIQEDAERWALQQLSRFATELDLFAGRGPIRRPTNGGLAPDKDIGLVMHGLRFPVPERGPRVNWGERMEGFSVEAFNRTDASRSVAVSVFVLQGNRQVAVSQPRDVVNLGAGGRHAYGPLTVEFAKGVFPEPGHYVLRALMVDPADGTRLDELNRHIWVEEDPPFRAPFDIQAASLPAPNENRQWAMHVDGDGHATLRYNVDHPTYRYAEGEEADLRLYFLDICLEGAMYLILRRPEGPEGPDYHPLEASKIEESPVDCFMEVAGKMAELRGRIYSGLA
jgi:hypothetical protein